MITQREVPAQVDGEPWKLVPSDVTIALKNRVPMLQKSEKKSLVDSTNRGDNDTPPPSMEAERENEKEEEIGKKMESKEEDEGREKRDKRRSERKEEKKREKSSRLERKREKKEGKKEKEEKREDVKEEKQEDQKNDRHDKGEEKPAPIVGTLSFDDLQDDTLKEPKTVLPKSMDDPKRLLRNNASVGDVYRKAAKK